jgi:hypothetical protein
VNNELNRTWKKVVVVYYHTGICRHGLRKTTPIQREPGALSPRVKRPGREADHSSPSNSEVNNGGAIPLLPPMSSWHRA